MRGRWEKGESLSERKRGLLVRQILVITPELIGRHQTAFLSITSSPPCLSVIRPLDCRFHVLSARQVLLLPFLPWAFLVKRKHH